MPSRTANTLTVRGQDLAEAFVFCLCGGPQGFTGSGVEVLENVNSEAVLRAKLVFVGGCRNEADRERMSALVTKAAQLVRAQSVDRVYWSTDNGILECHILGCVR